MNIQDLESDIYKKDWLDGYNNGYILAEKFSAGTQLREEADNYLKENTIEEGTYLDGLFLGHRQWELERIRERLQRLQESREKGQDQNREQTFRERDPVE